MLRREELGILGYHFFSDTMTPGVTFTVVLKYIFSKIIRSSKFLSDKNKWQWLSMGKSWLLSPSAKKKKSCREVPCSYAWRFKTSLSSALEACCATLIAQGGHGPGESSWHRIFQSKEFSCWPTAKVHRAECSIGQRMVDSWRISISCGISDL